MLKFLSLLLGLFVVGCSYFSPSYQKPQVDLPDNWANNTSITPISESLPYLAWWQQFNDPQLNYYIESGLKNNINIQLAEANLEAAQSQLSLMKLNWLPFLSIFGGYINGSSQNNLAPVGNLGVINSTGGFFALLPAYTMNVFTNYTLQKQAKYNLEAAKNSELSVRLAVIGQVSSSYFANLAQEQLVQQFTKLNKDVSTLVAITEALDKQGLANQVSINDLQSKQHLIEGQLALANKNLSATQNALRYLINQTPGKITSNNKFSKINPYQVIPGNMPVSVIASRPDVLKAEAQLKAANEGISVASSALLPSINLNYFYAQGSGSQTYNNPTPISSVSNTNSNSQSYYAAYANWTISPSVFGQINVNSALFKAALANYKYVVNTALHEVDNALVANNGYNQKAKSDEAAYLSLEKNVQIKQAMLKRGLTTNMLVLASIIEQDILAIDITQTKLQQLVSLVTIYQSLGGGYQYNESSEDNNSK